VQAVRGAFKGLNLNNAAPWFLVATLAWAPFPLGSNRGWSWSLLAILVAISWLLWIASEWKRPEVVVKQLRPVLPAAVLVLLPLAWGVAQTSSWLPQSIAHPVWSIASTGLSKNLPGTVSIDPWRTETELMKLSTYAMSAWLFYALARETGRARMLFNAIIAIGVFYCLYAWIFAAFDLHQFSVFYSVRDIGNRVASPFINKNSLATYAGLISLCCALKLVERADTYIAARKGFAQRLLATIQFTFGSGTIYLLVFLLTFGLLVATGSLAGGLATFAAFLVVIGLSTLGSVRRRLDTISALLGLALLGSMAAFFYLAGGELGNKLVTVAQSGLNENLRLTLWTAAERMIADSPLLGMGLGTYQQAYPLYESTFQPYLMDKAHNDYLELAAGWGLPAAVSWIGGIGWLVWLCVRGTLVRNRDRIYAWAGLGAAVLVGVHSAFDFPLQIPAISFLFSALIGIAVAQSLPSSVRTESRKRRPRGT
jgi:O-antigen ligase